MNMNAICAFCPIQCNKWITYIWLVFSDWPMILTLFLLLQWLLRGFCFYSCSFCLCCFRIFCSFPSCCSMLLSNWKFTLVPQKIDSTYVSEVSEQHSITFISPRLGGAILTSSTRTSPGGILFRHCCMMRALCLISSIRNQVPAKQSKHHFTAIHPGRIPIRFPGELQANPGQHLPYIVQTNLVLHK